MERQLITKRGRVYAVEPSKIAQAMFAKDYVNFLVPSLMKINSKLSSEENCSHFDLGTSVKYEVDMALVFSAQGFGWSNALKFKLQRDYANVGRSMFHTPLSTHLPLSSSLHNISTNSHRTCTSSIVQNEAHDHQNAVTPVEFSPNTSFRSKVKKCRRKSKVLVQAKESEEEKMGNRLKNIRMLVPGGEEMSDEQVLAELGTYITCLEMQVNILHHLVETH
ncbi:transcription factor bHLH [Quillaja saponaria]|uniref:Transcription factor bHLH n=1 Tax=Quillaja saponaria TaxID=32244 RepID=A0AAD7LCV5_QUISA|nr:transcription factor bHLH [Quillaja saponaria]